MNPHVLKSDHWIVEVEVLDVDRHKPCINGRDDAVEKTFDSGEFSSWCADFAFVHNSIATPCEADMIRLGLVGISAATMQR